MSSSLERLKQEGLPDSALEYLNELPDAARTELANQLVASMELKDSRLEGAMGRALEVVPLPLRGAVRKLLFS